ncbi:MAG: DUF3224 domain-containing protein [Pyrinomonadaceae bacterium]
MKQLMILIAACLLLSFSAAAQTKTKKENFTMTARGTFDVKVIPQGPDDKSAGPFGRMLLDKKFQGDLTGSSQGQMLAAMTAVKGSGAYVALELVDGVLNGKKGTFMLQHSGTMQSDAFDMQIQVVPDSGTGELEGIEGKLKIIIEGEKHSYEFTYDLGKKR